MRDGITVLTIDLQTRFIHKTPERQRAIADATQTYRDFFRGMRSRGAKIVHLQVINDVATPHLDRCDGFLPLKKGDADNEILPAFVAQGDIILKKRKDSGFHQTSLHARLQSLQIGTIVMTGLQRQICLQATAADAFFKGYNVWVPRDCVVAGIEADKIRALDWLTRHCATVSDSRTILATLDREGLLPRRAVGDALPSLPSAQEPAS